MPRWHPNTFLEALWHTGCESMISEKNRKNTTKAAKIEEAVKKIRANFGKHRGGFTTI